MRRTYPNQRSGKRCRCTKAPSGPAITIAEPWLTTSGIELEREGPSYTFDTLVDLAAAVGESPDVELWLILGSDNLSGLAQWHRVRELLALARPIVVWRGGEDPEGIPGELLATLGEPIARRLIEGFLSVPPHPARATDLRAALAAGNFDSPDLPAGVGDYIRERGLYSGL